MVRAARGAACAGDPGADLLHLGAAHLSQLRAVARDVRGPGGRLDRHRCVCPAGAPRAAAARGRRRARAPGRLAAVAARGPVPGRGRAGRARHLAGLRLLRGVAGGVGRRRGGHRGRAARRGGEPPAERPQLPALRVDRGAGLPRRVPGAVAGVVDRVRRAPRWGRERGRRAGCRPARPRRSAGRARGLRRAADRAAARRHGPHRRRPLPQHRRAGRRRHLVPQPHDGRPVHADRRARHPVGAAAPLRRHAAGRGQLPPQPVHPARQVLRRAWRRADDRHLPGGDVPRGAGVAAARPGPRRQRRVGGPDVGRAARPRAGAQGVRRPLREDEPLDRRAGLPAGGAPGPVRVPPAAPAPGLELPARGHRLRRLGEAARHVLRHLGRVGRDGRPAAPRATGPGRRPAAGPADRRDAAGRRLRRRAGGRDRRPRLRLRAETRPGGRSPRATPTRSCGPR